MNISVSRHLYRILLRLYPSSFRTSYGEEMEAAFVASLRLARRRWGRMGIPLGWVRILGDTLWYALHLRFSARGMGSGPAPRAGRHRAGLLGPWGLALWEDARSAARHLARNRGFTVTAVCTLALGIGLNTAVFGAVYSLLLRPLPGVEAPQELVQVYRTRGMDPGFLPVSIPLFQDMQARGEPFSGVAAWTFAPLSTSVGDGGERVLGQIVSQDFFDVLGVPMVRGRGLPKEGDGGGEALRAVVVSESFWRNQLGGAPGVVGMTLGINGAQWEVVGVASRDFRGPLPVLAPALWAPLSLHPELMRDGDQSENRGNNFLDVVGRLRPGTTLGQAQDWANLFAARLQEGHPDFHEDVGFRLFSQAKAGIHPSVRSAQVGLSGVSMGMVGLLLVIACVNVASLFLAKGQERSREVAVRRSLGAPRRRLISQLLLESLLLSVLAGGVGVFLALWGTNLMNRIRVPVEWTVSWNIGMDGPVLAFLVGLTLLTSLIFGLAPAFRSSNPGIVSSLKGEPPPGAGRPKRAGRLLVGTQVAVSTVLLVCAGLFARNLRDAQAVDLGFRHGELALATLDPGLQGYGPEASVELFAELLARVRALPGVQAAGLARQVPMEPGGAQQLVEVPGYQASRGEPMNIQYNIVDPGYFAAMGIPLEEGRGFLSSDEVVELGAPGGRQRGTVVVVNRQFADRYWFGEPALGKRFQAGGMWHEVVGVVATGRYQRLGEDPTAFMYFPWPAHRSGEMTLHVRTATDPGSVLPLLRGVVGAMSPGLPLYDMKTMDEHLSLALLPARVAAFLLGGFGAVCLFLLSLGIHGVVSRHVGQRTREMGIRVAMGAAPGSATRLVLGGEARVVVAGLVLGLACAWAIARLVEGILYSGRALDPAIFLGAPFFLGLVAGLASWLPARKAAGLDPAQALRVE